jgi:sugar transferase (PEP-CTERM/EpsH1 system associated)
LPEAFDSIAVVSEAEADCYRSFQPSNKIRAVPNGVDLKRFVPNPSVPVKPDSCVFVGALDYKPNAEAVGWFCDAVWPAVLEARPEAVFTIVGRNPTSAVKQLAQRPGVKLLADVADVRPSLWESAIAVAPLQIARGVQNKVLEAMAVAKPVVVSPQALVGIRAEGGKHLCVAKSPDEWARICLELFDAAELRQKLGLAAREFVEAHHSWRNCLQPIADMLVARS